MENEIRGFEFSNMWHLSQLPRPTYWHSYILMVILDFWLEGITLLHLFFHLLAHVHFFILISEKFIQATQLELTLFFFNLSFLNLWLVFLFLKCSWLKFCVGYMSVVSIRYLKVSVWFRHSVYYLFLGYFVLMQGLWSI